MRTSTFNQKYFKSIIKDTMICVDMTAGNGNDTFYLARLAKAVYAFDIQQEALDSTAKRCKDYQNISYILDNHANIKKHIDQKIDVVFFNLGYLPGSSSDLTSNVKDTTKAILDSYDLLNDGGYLSITSYRGQHGGLAEFNMIEELITQKKLKLIEKYHSYDNLLEPILYIFRK